jgi:hypothetical protein
MLWNGPKKETIFGLSSGRAQTVGQSLINELFFAFTDWMHCLMMRSLCQQRKVGLLEPESQSGNRVFVCSQK